MRNTDLRRPPLRVPAAHGVVGGDLAVEPDGVDVGALAVGLQEAGRQGVEGARPALRQVEPLLDVANAGAGRAQIVGCRRQAGDGAMERGALLGDVVQRVAQELAERQGIEQRRLVLRRRGRRRSFPGVGLGAEASDRSTS